MLNAACLLGDRMLIKATILSFCTTMAHDGTSQPWQRCFFCFKGPTHEVFLLFFKDQPTKQDVTMVQGL